MTAKGGIYVPLDRFQPVSVGVDDKGEILWDRKFKEPWQTKQLPVRYRGDFGEQWMYLCLMEKGFEWREHDNG